MRIANNRRTKRTPRTKSKSQVRKAKKLQKKLSRSATITGAPLERDRTSQWHKTIKESRRAVKKVRRKKEGIFVEKPISMRHEKYLDKPSKPFAQGYTDQERIGEGMGLGSTAVVSYTYYLDERLLILHWWKDWKRGIPGSEYAYFNVPQWRFERLLRASSKGRYIYYNIRTTYKYQRLN